MKTATANTELIRTFAASLMLAAVGLLAVLLGDIASIADGACPGDGSNWIDGIATDIASSLSLGDC